MSNIILYHGTTADFKVIDLKHCKDKKDFGKGFYTTTDINQAVTLAKRMQMQQFLNGNTYAKAYVYSVKIDTTKLTGFNQHRFQTASIAWLDYIIENRYYNFDSKSDFDIVIGKVADAQTRRLINNFITDFGKNATNAQKQQLIKKLQPDNLIDQHCFKSDAVINFLNTLKIMRKEY